MKVMFIVPRLSGGGAEKVIIALATLMSSRHDVYLVSTSKPDIQNNYPVTESDTLTLLNLYTDTNEEKESEREKFSQNTQPSDENNYILENKVLSLYHQIRAILPGFLSVGISRLANYIIRKIWQITIAHKHKKTDISDYDRLKKLKNDLNIDCSISFLNSANYLNAMSSIGENTIISIRSYPEGDHAPADYRSEFGKSQIKKACRKSDHIVCVSQEAVYGLISKFRIPKRKISVIYNICDQDNIIKLSKEKINDPVIEQVLDQADFVLSASGRLTEKKGHWHLIRAFRDILKIHPNSILIISGADGKDEENTAPLLKEIISENHLEKNVFLLGFHLNPFKYLVRSDVFVLPSFNEGLPNVLLEAMALGLPVIASDCRSGPREILAPNTDCRIKTDTIEYADYGVLVPECSGHKLITEPLEDNEQLLKKAMLKLMEDPALRNHYSKMSNERIKYFSEDSILDQWEDLISRKK